MNVLIIDTSSWISYFKKGGNIIDIALKESRVYITPVIASELLSGVSNKKDQVGLIDLFNELPICGLTIDHWYKTGKLRAKLLQSGFTISTPDAHICQAVLDIDGYLLSEDKIFHKIAPLIKLKLAKHN